MSFFSRRGPFLAATLTIALALSACARNGVEDLALETFGTD